MSLSSNLDFLSGAFSAVSGIGTKIVSKQKSPDARCFDLGSLHARSLQWSRVMADTTPPVPVPVAKRVRDPVAVIDLTGSDPVPEAKRVKMAPMAVIDLTCSDPVPAAERVKMDPVVVDTTTASHPCEEAEVGSIFVRSNMYLQTCQCPHRFLQLS